MGIDATRTAPGYLVLGMHRSGTSCLTGLLETCGLSLGDVARRSKHNPKGNLEDGAIRAVNVAILKQFRGSWHRPPRRIDWAGVDAEPIREALAPYRGRPGWIIKDPRMLLTLPAWLPHLSNPRFVGTFRHPLAVARSLVARGDRSIDAGIALWSDYNGRLVELHRRTAFPLLRFDAAHYLARFEALCRSEGLAFDRARATEFFDSALVHASDEGEVALPGHAAEVFDYLLRYELVAHRRAT